MTTIPSISDLPTPPQTSDPTNFDTRADAFLAALDDPFVAEVNAFATAANTVAGQVSTNATNAASSASAASTSASSASSSASTATTQATNAASSATAAASSATAAATSATNAATSAGALSANANSYRTVDYVATSNVAISTALANGQTLDGGTLATGQRVLLTAQTTGSQNGIYDVPASGAASRSSDSNTAVLMPSGINVSVTRGTAGAGSSWRHNTAPGFTLGSTSLTFAKSGMIDSSSGSGGQLKFPATQNPSSDANTLDDYKENTFMPVLTIGGASTGITYSAQTGSYTKIGNRVLFEITILLSSKGSLTGNVAISLPFTAVTATAYHGTASVQPLNTVSTNYVFGDIGSGASTMTMATFSAGAGSTITQAHLNNTSQFNISGHYIAA